MAFVLSPLSLDRLPFEINPMVENMHSTATDEVCVLVYRCLHQGAPVYLSELCIPVASSMVGAISVSGERMPRHQLLQD